jgi:hypothetical protein
MVRLMAVIVLCAPLAASAAPSGVSLAELGAAGGPLADQVRREAAQARKRGLQPVAELSADWCKPCAAIKRYLGDPAMVDAFKGGWKEAELSAAGLRTVGVPMFFALDANGRPTGRTITSSVWGDDIPANMAPPLKRFFASLAEPPARKR